MDPSGPQAVLCFGLRADQSGSSISWDAPCIAALGKVIVGGGSDFKATDGHLRRPPDTGGDSGVPSGTRRTETL